jgi:hypothetical protein
VNVNQDFKKGFMVCAGVVVALYVIGLATGTIRRIV